LVLLLIVLNRNITSDTNLTIKYLVIGQPVTLLHCIIMAANAVSYKCEHSRIRTANFQNVNCGW